MRSIHGLSFALAAVLFAAASAQADTGGSVVVQSSAAIGETAAVNTDLAAARPDLLISGNGFVFSTNASNTVLPGTTVAPLGRNFTSAQYAAYYNNQLFNYFLAPPPDTRAYTDYFLLTYPGYVISTWTDRVAGIPSTGIGTATDQWTAAVYYMPRVRAFSGPDAHPVIDERTRFRSRPHIDERSSFRRSY
jgi:hypothetical protein